jgi:hypothetical protein
MAMPELKLYSTPPDHHVPRTSRTHLPYRQVNFETDAVIPQTYMYASASGQIYESGHDVDGGTLALALGFGIGFGTLVLILLVMGGILFVRE